MSYILNGANWALDVPDNIPSLLGSHLYITGVTLLFGVLIAFAFAFLIMRFPRLYLPVITTAGIVYTLPSVAVVAFLIAITGLSDTTLIIPLVAYAQVVLIRNIVTGIRAVDPSLVEVGRAMGMNARQLQARVVLPLALPVIVAGVRVVAVTTIGIAAIGPLVGVDDLGRLIFQGSTFSNTDQIEAGAILITALALATDFILLGVQRLLNPGRVGVARA
jgi:osmoprotectant transport system permease protein